MGWIVVGVVVTVVDFLTNTQRERCGFAIGDRAIAVNFGVSTFVGLGEVVACGFGDFDQEVTFRQVDELVVAVNVSFLWENVCVVDVFRSAAIGFFEGNSYVCQWLIGCAALFAVAINIFPDGVTNTDGRRWGKCNTKIDSQIRAIIRCTLTIITIIYTSKAKLILWLIITQLYRTGANNTTDSIFAIIKTIHYVVWISSLLRARTGQITLQFTTSLEVFCQDTYLVIACRQTTKQVTTIRIGFSRTAHLRTCAIFQNKFNASTRTNLTNGGITTIVCVNPHAIADAVSRSRLNRHRSAGFVIFQCFRNGVKPRQ